MVVGEILFAAIKHNRLSLFYDLVPDISYIITCILILAFLTKIT